MCGLYEVVSCNGLNVAYLLGNNIKVIKYTGKIRLDSNQYFT